LNNHIVFYVDVISTEVYYPLLGITRIIRILSL